MATVTYTISLNTTFKYVGTVGGNSAYISPASVSPTAIPSSFPSDAYERRVTGVSISGFSVANSIPAAVNPSISIALNGIPTVAYATQGTVSGSLTESQIASYNKTALNAWSSFAVQVFYTGQAGIVGTGPVATTGSLVVTGGTITVTYDDSETTPPTPPKSRPQPPTGSNPPPPQDATYTNIFFTKPPPTVAVGTAFSCVTATRKDAGAGSSYVTGGTRRLALSTGGADVSNAFVTTASSGFSTYLDVADAGGRGTFSAVTLSTAGVTTDGSYTLKGSWLTQPGLAPAIHSFTIGGAGQHLKFTDQPASVVEAGTDLGTTEVTLTNSTGGTITSVAADVTLTIADVQGTELSDQTPLAGTLTVSLATGVASFTNLAITKNGQYTLKAEATSTATTSFGTTVSDIITVLGIPDDGEAIGLRQNTLHDGTVWRKTTGISSPTFSLPSQDDLKRINGDLFTTSGVTTDGFRFTFPWWFRLKKIALKGLLSATAGTSIKVYTSTDAAAPSAGTWTVLSTTTPEGLGFANEVSYATPTICKGVWATLDDGTGAVNCTWQAIHVFGSYVNPDLAIINPSTLGPIGDEELLSIPSPPTTLSGSQVVTRDLVIENNTDDDWDDLSIITDAARYGGDTLVDSDNVDLLDTEDTALTLPTTVPARSTYQFRVRYTIDDGDNDNSGQHLIRLTFTQGLSSDQVLFPRTDGDLDSTNMGFYRLNNGSRLTSLDPFTTSATTIGGVAISWPRREIYSILAGNDPWTCRVHDVDSLAFVRDMTLTVTSATVPMSDFAIAGDNLHITTTAGGTANALFVFSATSGTYITKTNLSSGPSSTDRKIINTPNNDTYCHVENGTDDIVRFASDGSITDSVNTTGFASYLAYDGVNDRLIRGVRVGNVVRFTQFSQDLVEGDSSSVDFNATFGLTLSAVYGIVHNAARKEYVFVLAGGVFRVYSCDIGDYAGLTFVTTIPVNTSSINGIKHIASAFPQ